MEKKNYSTILVAILCLLIGGVGGFFLNNQPKEDKKEEITQNNENKNENKQEEKKDYILYEYIEDYNNDGYNIYIKKDNNLYIKYDNEDLNKKFGEYKLADNVLDFNILDVGNGGSFGLYFINKDHTVGFADIVDTDVTNINVKKDLGYKNVIEIIPYLYGDEISGFWDAAFIGENNQIYKQF